MSRRHWRIKLIVSFWRSDTPGLQLATTIIAQRLKWYRSSDSYIAQAIAEEPATLWIWNITLIVPSSLLCIIKFPVFRLRRNHCLSRLSSHASPITNTYQVSTVWWYQHITTLAPPPTRAISSVLNQVTESFLQQHVLRVMFWVRTKTNTAFWAGLTA